MDTQAILSTKDAEALLHERLTADGDASKYIAAFHTRSGRHLALERESARTQVWLEVKPPSHLTYTLEKAYDPNDARNSNLNNKRGSSLAVGNRAFLISLPSREALTAMIEWYEAVPTRNVLKEESNCLIGTWGGLTRERLEELQAYIETHGAWASWWSFGLKPESREGLGDPFWLYLNRGLNSIVARLEISGVMTSDKGIPTPWPEQTDGIAPDATSEGPAKAQQFRTWFRATAAEWLDPPLQRNDFEPIEGLSSAAGLLNQNTFGYARRAAQRDDTIPSFTSFPGKATTPSLNTILYGPPGTSKTFETIDRALQIIDPDFLRGNHGQRSALKQRFDALCKEGRIEFVTFHQSYSYEDFVQGIRASTEDDKVVYEMVDGVFKRMCIRATTKGGDNKFREALEEFKQKVSEDPVDLKTERGNIFNVTWRKGKTFAIRPVKGQQDAVYSASINNVDRLYRGDKDGSIYNLSYVLAIMNHVKKVANIPDYKPDRGRKPYVLIIDEINRGNIASIFGELITLIEPSKRDGAAEALGATLAYADEVKTTLTVPDNLYILGTMNTADRSLARLDTALRRRFDFIPMYPRYDKLDGVLVGEVDLGALLRRINERIELLYDRDHQIGHAFFMGLADDPERSIEDLALIFDSRILPLLEEYFFEEWQRIRLVLADNQKTDSAHQFITSDDLSSAKGIFGDVSFELPSVRYHRNPDALMQAESYRLVYETS